VKNIEKDVCGGERIELYKVKVVKKMFSSRSEERVEIRGWSNKIFF
jgi:hypothetical protein